MHGSVGMAYGNGRVAASTVQILASSLPFTLIRYGTSLRLLDQVPKFPNSDTALLVRVKVSSSLGLPVAGAFIMVRTRTKHVTCFGVGCLPVNIAAGLIRLL